MFISTFVVIINIFCTWIVVPKKYIKHEKSKIKAPVIIKQFLNIVAAFCRSLISYLLMFPATKFGFWFTKIPAIISTIALNEKDKNIKKLFLNLII